MGAHVIVNYYNKVGLPDKALNVANLRPERSVMNYNFEIPTGYACLIYIHQLKSVK